MSDKAYDNTVLGEGGYSDAGEVDLSKVLTGEDTSNTLINMMLGVAGPAGTLKGLTQLLKSKGGVEIIKRIMPKSKDVKKFIEGMNKKSLENLKAINKEIKKGVTTKKPVETITPKQVDEFIKKEATTNLPLTGQTPAASKWNIEAVKKTKDASEKFSLADPIVPSLLVPIIFALDDLNNTYGWSNKMASLLRPDPDMGTKEQHDEDMINLLYSLKDNPKPEAKGQRLEDSLPNQININEILMRKLYEQINKNKIQDEQDEEISYPSKGYGALF